MHIPDGYLSPETCAALYAAAAPFWYVALRRVRRMLNTRVVPTLSLFAALSFVIMMFNLPLPGGTTGHAIGVGIAAIILGPWASIITISVALLIQAVFFGDGGVTAFGANSLNMAVVGSLVASGVYRLLSARAPLGSTRRVVAAAVAGYAAINAAALCAGVEFGIQPRFFHDAAGAPLYAPYPLSVAVPAMLIGHLTLAGLAEMFITAGVVAYLQRTDSALLRLNTRATANSVEVARQSIWGAARPLWLALAALLILTPLGLLAAGTAWGEWGPQDFSDAQARARIASASGNQAPPAQAPAGLERLSHLWSAPMPDYAPPFLKSAAFGYLMSALFGAGLVILFFLLLGRLARAARGVG
ncbi:MAG TPA: cobalt transporter CbiM [Pyrinomonadaceae bacterium]|nr:cobalt transporter CbiM [Pyrinomonadaceae bacterium]